MQLTLGRAAAVMGGRLVRGESQSAVTGARYDRADAIQPGDILFLPGRAAYKAIKLRLAVTKQVLAVVTDEYWSDQAAENCGWIRVQDCRRAFWQLVSYWREQVNPTTIAITGSSGKTTSKEALAAVLGQDFCVHTTKDNLNMIRFVPRHIFQLEPHHHFSVWETGIKRLGELRRMCRYIRPDIGIVTNIGWAHSGKLGGISNTIRAKGELVEALPESGMLFLNSDNEYSRYLPSFRGCTETFGMGEDATIRASEVSYHEGGMGFSVFFRNSAYTFNLPLLGVHNVYNVLPAIALGIMHGITPKHIQKGLNSINLPAFRWQVTKCPGEVVIVNDAYNASPESVRAGLSAFVHVYCSHRKIAVLGDMLELGRYTAEAHYRTGVFAASLGLEGVVLVGQASHFTALGFSDANFGGMVHRCSSCEEAHELLQELITPETAVYIKGSHDTGLFRLGQRIAVFCKG